MAGNLAEMRWPNFRDYKPWLQEFYEPSGFAPAWVQGSMPSQQARAMIDFFAHARQKGLEPDDYDASCWEERLRSLAGSSGDPAGFDVALTVCTMRYISDLRIGRINPKHVKFDLLVEQKKYDLAQFLRDSLLPAADVSAVVESVEPSFGGYRRAEQALVRYTELVRADNGGELPVPAKTIDPGQPYVGAARLASLLKLVGDLPADFPAPTLETYDARLAEGVKRFQRCHGATMAAALFTSSGRSAWFVGVFMLMVYLVLAMTLYLLPPQA